jgi:hypothetical protein
MPDERLRLLYVASIGRSGSTLLELLLAAHPAIATVGELHLWPHELRPGGRHLPCACGQDVTSCPFWIEVARRVDPLGAPPPQIDAFRERHEAGRTLRLRRLRDVLRAGDLGGRADVATYAANNERAYRAYLDVTAESTGQRPSFLVDASKDVYRLAWLAGSGRFDVTVLHVVRDPRGFVSSERANLDAEGARLWRLAARKGAAWSVHNQLVRWAARSMGRERYVHVPYEALAGDPAGTLAGIGRVIGRDLGREQVDGFRTVGGHAIGGNPMRHADGDIRVDLRWRSTLPGAAQRLALAASTLNRRAFGYGGGGHR